MILLRRSREASRFGHGMRVIDSQKHISLRSRNGDVFFEGNPLLEKTPRFLIKSRANNAVKRFYFSGVLGYSFRLQ